MTKFSLILAIVVGCVTSVFGQSSYTIRGSVSDRLSGEPLPYAAVVVDGQNNKGTLADSLGRFSISGIEAGIYSFAATALGYEPEVTAQYQISATTPPINIEMSPSLNQLEQVVVTPSLFIKTNESPVSMRRVGVEQIEKSAGANRDVSRIVQSLPGVSFSPAGYRNDLIVRGGSPSENKFYIDGIEILNINHFSTQGASGGPVSIINADLVRQIDFYSGAFGADKSGALSSVLDMKLKSGNSERQSFKATVGASEVSLSGSGHFSPRTTYLFSVRQSYLQFLFKLIGLPLLPNFVDGQVKIQTKFDKRNTLTFLALVGFDNMSLNEDGTIETTEYLLSYLPVIKQNTFTVGATYRHVGDNSSQLFSLSHTYLYNRNTKYQDNDDSSQANLNYRIASTEQKSTLRNENNNYLGRWTLRYGGELTHSTYNIGSLVRYVADGGAIESSQYGDWLPIWGWGLHATGSYTSPNDRLKGSIGMRMDGNSFSGSTAQFWRQFSPRASLSYKIANPLTLNASCGIYYQMPPFTALAYRDVNGDRINSKLGYTSVSEVTLGVAWQLRNRLMVSVEGFYKDYDDLLLSINDNIPLAGKGNDYGIVGNEPLAQSVDGRSYGVEFLGRWMIPNKVSLVGSLTLFRSLYRNTPSDSYISSAWDNRVIFNTSGTYFMKRGWSVGAKFSAIGGAPYTPYDVENSSLKSYWDTSGRPLYDYTTYNSERFDPYAQLDLRVDKMFYFKRWMLGVYLDIQNVTVSKFHQPSIPISSGEIANPAAPAAQQRYIMKYLPNISGTMLPTVGITAEF